MECKHERLKTVNNRLFCMDCGAELPIELLTQPKEKPTKKPAKKKQ